MKYKMCEKISGSPPYLLTRSLERGKTGEKNSYKNRRGKGGGSPKWLLLGGEFLLGLGEESFVLDDSPFVDALAHGAQGIPGGDLED